MKKLVLGMSLFVTATAANALSNNAKFVAQDNTLATNLCVIAATKGINAAKFEAKKYSTNTLAITSCNGVAIKKFAKQYKETTNTVSIKSVKVVPADQSSESKICAKAANKGLRSINNVSQYVMRNIVCNGQKIETFAKLNASS